MQSLNPLIVSVVSHQSSVVTSNSINIISFKSREIGEKYNRTKSTSARAHILYRDEWKIAGVASVKSPWNSKKVSPFTGWVKSSPPRDAGGRSLQADDPDRRWRAPERDRVIRRIHEIIIEQPPHHLSVCFSALHGRAIIPSNYSNWISVDSRSSSRDNSSTRRRSNFFSSASSAASPLPLSFFREYYSGHWRGVCNYLE